MITSLSEIPSVGATFKKELPHAREQCSPNFRHPHALPKPLEHEQKIILKMESGVGGCVDGTGNNKLYFKTQP